MLKSAKLLSLSLLFFSGSLFAAQNLKYLGFEFGKEPDKEFIKDFKCVKNTEVFTLCSNSKDRQYFVITDKNNIVRKVSQSISTSSYKDSFSCLRHLRAYAQVLNDDYQAEINIPTNQPFFNFNSTIIKNNIEYKVTGQCENLPEDIVFKTAIEDTRYSVEFKEQINIEKNNETSDPNSIQRDFE